MIIVGKEISFYFENVLGCIQYCHSGLELNRSIQWNMTDNMPGIINHAVYTDSYRPLLVANQGGLFNNEYKIPFFGLGWHLCEQWWLWNDTSPMFNSVNGFPLHYAFCFPSLCWHDSETNSNISKRQSILFQLSLSFTNLALFLRTCFLSTEANLLKGNMF
jgi:hypothetical protein